MNRIKKVEPLVRNILENYKETRGDNFLLVYYVYSRFCPIVDNTSFESVMKYHRELGLPSIESITRARRKLQAENEELRPEEKILEIRKEEEKEYIKYSKK